MKLTRLVPAVVLALAAPIGVSLTTRTLADALGRDLGRTLATTLSAARPEALGPRERAPQEPEPGALLPMAVVKTEPAPEKPARLAKAPAKGAKTPRSKTPREGPLGVRVGTHTVLELAERRALPSARPVPAQGERPAGLELYGVGGLGVGMRDGDILTSVAGVPVTSVGAVTELVLRARAHRTPEISAQFWRNGATGTLVVEQPYAPTPN